MILVPSGAQLFDVQYRSTTLNTWEIILWSLLPLELSCSRRFNRVEPLQTLVELHSRPGSLCCVMVQVRKSWTTPNTWEITLFPIKLSDSRRFVRVEPPWTHEKLSYDTCVLRSSVVRGCSVALNHPERQASLHTWRIELLFNGSKRFGRVDPPQARIILGSLLPLDLSGLKRFSGVASPQTPLQE